MLDGLIEGILATSLIEWVAVATSLTYVILAAQKRILCWLFAFISSSLYVYLCFSTQLYLETVLQFFYVVMAIVGFVLWSRSAKEEDLINGDILDEPNETSDKKRSGIVRWPVEYHIVNVLLSTIAAILLGFLFSIYTNQANPYVDAATTVFSLAATFMVTKKVLENWIYWIIIDTVSVYLYFSRGLQLTAVLFVLFTVLAIVGYFSWKKSLTTQQG